MKNKKYKHGTLYTYDAKKDEMVPFTITIPAKALEPNPPQRCSGTVRMVKKEGVMRYTGSKGIIRNENE